MHRRVRATARASGSRSAGRPRWNAAARTVVAVLLLALVACASEPRAHTSLTSDPRLGADVEVREARLANDFVLLTMIIPRQPPGPKPVLIEAGSRDPAAIVGANGELLRRGVIVAHFQNNWQPLREAFPPAQAMPDRPPVGRPGDTNVAAGKAVAPERPGPKPAEPQTVGSWLLAAPRPGIVGRSYFQFVAVSAHTSVPAVVEHLGTLAEVDPRRIAIVGRSTGGFVVLEALAQEPRLAVGLVRVACGDYHDFLQKSSLALAGNPRWLVDGKIVLDADYEAELRVREPIRTAGRLPPRPLLLQNGGRDPAMPTSCALGTARVFERAYALQGLPERFRFILWDDRGHDLGPDAQAEEIRWCERWLLEER